MTTEPAVPPTADPSREAATTPPVDPSGETTQQPPIDQNAAKPDVEMIPKPRFDEVYSKLKTLEETTSVLEDPTAYRAWFINRHGVDPFGAPGQGQQPQPEGDAELPERAPEDFDTDAEYQMYEHLRRLSARFSEQDAQVRQAQEIRERQEALTEFDQATAGIEQRFGVQLGQQEKADLLEQAGMIGLAFEARGKEISVAQAVDMVAKSMYFDKAVSIGRTEAEQILAQKNQIASGRTSDVQGPTGQAAGRMDLRSAMEKAWGDT
ncbi:MAG: hypothetical protein ABFD94_12040 [Armatimonadia bacterium]